MNLTDAQIKEGNELIAKALGWEKKEGNVKGECYWLVPGILLQGYFWRGYDVYRSGKQKEHIRNATNALVFHTNENDLDAVVRILTAMEILPKGWVSAIGKSRRWSEIVFALKKSL